MSQTMSPEELRAARLRRLEVGSSAATESNISVSPAKKQQLESIKDSSGSNVYQGLPCPRSSEQESPMKVDECKQSADDLIGTILSVEDLHALAKITYIGGGATLEDMQRWYSQGFSFSKNLNISNFPGFRQAQGGPCGVLCVVQAELLVQLFFVHKLPLSRFIEPHVNIASALGSVSFPELSEDILQDCFVEAILSILVRAAQPNSYATSGSISEGCLLRIVYCDIQDLEKPFPGFDELTNLNLYTITMTDTQSAKLFLKQHYNMYFSSQGCMLFLLSLVLTRGIAAIESDMDQPGTLISQFGHCTQDLVNLLIAGKATSNVMDGNIPLGDSGLTIKGIRSKCRIGYLTQLEALQLCQVGSYLKYPEYPVWVIGSSSHFSVLFGTDIAINEESESEKLQTRLQRAFKSIDIGECGYITGEQLPVALMNIDEAVIYELLGDDDEMTRLRRFMCSDGDFILWSNFWENVSRLMTGTTLDALLDEKARLMQTSIDPMITGFPNLQHNAESKTSNTLIRTDSELARELQAQWAAEESNPAQPITMQAQDVGYPLYNNNDRELLRTDSDLARALQDEWNSAVPALVPLPSMPPPAPAPIIAPVSVPVQSDRKFLLYHYNGLENTIRTALLTPLMLQIPDSVNNIGQSISLTSTSNQTYASSGTNMGGSSSLIDVLRTRWGTECQVLFEGNTAPPSID
jgi:hypothetical protein